MSEIHEICVSVVSLTNLKKKGLKNILKKDSKTHKNK